MHITTLSHIANGIVPFGCTVIANGVHNCRQAVTALGEASVAKLYGCMHLMHQRDYALTGSHHGRLLERNFTDWHVYYRMRGSHGATRRTKHGTPSRALRFCCLGPQ